MPIAEHDEFLRRQAFQAYWAARMKLVGANANFGAQPILKPIGKTRGYIYHHGTGINLPEKTSRGWQLLSNNSVGMARPVHLYMLDRLIKAIHHPNREDRSKIFRRPVFFRRCPDAWDDAAGGRAAE